VLERLRPFFPLLTIAAAACGDASYSSPFRGEPSGPAGEAPATPTVGATVGANGVEELTAGDFDDNLNLDFFSDFVLAFQQLHRGAPAWEPRGRVVISVDDGAGRPVPFAEVSVKQGTDLRFRGITGSDGRASFFPAIDRAAPGVPFELEATQGQVQARLVPTSTLAWEISLPGATSALPTAIDLAFVVDATGSMGDELRFLTAEIQSIVERVGALFPQVSMRLALIVYRDVHDDYVVRKFDFNGDLSVFRTALGRQSADGGGDYPEAMEQAVQAMNQLSWRREAARVAFLIADAPPQPENEERLLQHVLISRQQGIKIYPVAASGVADEAEYLMRWSAALTSSRYIFLTDDSGIGASHAEPHIPCYQVLKLNDVVVRTIASELKGRRVPAASADVIREVGTPVDGVCTEGQWRLRL